MGPLAQMHMELKNLLEFNFPINKFTLIFFLSFLLVLIFHFVSSLSIIIIPSASIKLFAILLQSVLSSYSHCNAKS